MRVDLTSALTLATHSMASKREARLYATRADIEVTTWEKRRRRQPRRVARSEEQEEEEEEEVVSGK